MQPLEDTMRTTEGDNQTKEEGSVCSKCKSSPAKVSCKQCELLYCQDCSQQRHRKGAFTRHEIAELKDCEECTERIAAIWCSECEMSLCKNCSADIHQQGAMRKHQENGCFTFILEMSSEKSLGERDSFSTAGSSLCAGDLNGTSAQKDAAEAALFASEPVAPAAATSDPDSDSKTDRSSIEQTLGSSLVMELNSSPAGPAESPKKYRTWGGWELFGSNRDSSDWSAGSAAAPGSSVNQALPAISQLNAVGGEKKYSTLSTFPSVGKSDSESENPSLDVSSNPSVLRYREQKAVDPFWKRGVSVTSELGSGTSSFTSSGITQNSKTRSLLPNRHIFESTSGSESDFDPPSDKDRNGDLQLRSLDNLLKPFVAEQTTRHVMIRTRPGVLDNVNEAALYDMFKAFGMVKKVNVKLAHRGIIVGIFFDLRVAYRAKQSLQGQDVAMLGLSENSGKLEASFLIPAENPDEDYNDGILRVKPIPLTVREEEVVAFFSKYGDVTSVKRDSFDVRIIEFPDVREARIALARVNGQEKWGEVLEVKALPPSQDTVRLMKQHVETLAPFEASQLPYQRNSDSIHSPARPHGMRAQNSNMPPGFNTVTIGLQGTLSQPITSTSRFGTTTPLYSNSGTFPTGAFGSDAESSSEPWGVGALSVSGRTSGPLLSKTRLSVGTSAGSALAARQRDQSPLTRDSDRSAPRSSNSDMQFGLDVEKIRAGFDKRTTVMVRNIPNKYTQKMLLMEINVNHQGLYDFFYLPIDFKNKCNVGYAFVNFIDYRSVIAFFNEFSDRKWPNFNSEKVCCITYARIQGKAAMIARFQNSSLMDKDDSYKPLIFHSSGEQQGLPEPFPIGPVRLERRTLTHRDRGKVRQRRGKRGEDGGYFSGYASSGYGSGYGSDGSDLGSGYGSGYGSEDSIF